MRLATVILVLAAIAVTLVNLRRRELAVRHETQQLQTQQVNLRRELWDQQARMGYLTAPSEVRRRVEEVVLNQKPSANQTGMRD